MRKIGTIALFLLLLACSVAQAQFNGPTGGVTPTFCVQGPGDVQPYVLWGGLRAYSMATCGQAAIKVCDSTGGVDVACADMVTSTTTGKLVPRVIGGLICGTDSSGLCTIQIIYDIPGAGAHNAVQNMIANRYSLYPTGGACQTTPNCAFSSAAGAGYLLSASLSLTQPFGLYVAATSVNSSATNTLISVGNANLHFASASPGNILSTCDSSGGTTAANTYQSKVFYPTQISDIILTCIGGAGTVLQNAFPGPTASSGGSTSASGTPAIMTSGGSPTAFWAFGITTANLASTLTNVFWTTYAIHYSACSAYGYTCFYSGMGDIAAFKAAWGLRAFNASIAALAQGNPLVNTCSANNALCSDILSQQRSGVALTPSVGGGGEGGGNASCFVSVVSGTYTTATGVTVLTVNPPDGIIAGQNPTGLASGNNFALIPFSGTGGFASLRGGWTVTSVTNTGGGDTATITFTGPTGLGTTTITGGTVSTCTIKTFYDICTIGGVPCNSCTGGVPCNLTQNTVANRAIFTVNCAGPGSPIFYGSVCAMFMSGSSQSYTGPGTTTTATPYSMMVAAKRTGNTSNFNTVLSCVPCSAGFANSANNAYAQDGTGLVTGAANDNLFHSILGESDGTNLRIYVDGTLATTNSGAGLSMAQPYGLGNKIGSSLYFQGEFLEGGLVNSNIAANAPAIAMQQQLFFGYVP